MQTQTIECPYCDQLVSYVPEANYIVFCPNCKRKIYLECEYGYGPVTPCSIQLGEDVIANLSVNENHQYILDDFHKKVILKNSYLDALEEAIKIISKKLNPHFNDQQDNLFEIKSQGGWLSFYGDSFGRPGDNFHEIIQSYYQDNILEILFRDGERLIVFEPEGIINTENELSIQSAKLVKWSWIPYGHSDKKIKKISYELRHNKICKMTSHGEEYLEKKSSCVAVYMR